MENRWLTTPLLLGEDNCNIQCFPTLSQPHSNFRLKHSAALLTVAACAEVGCTASSQAESYLLQPENTQFHHFGLAQEKNIEWQAPVLIKPAEALVPLVSCFHNYPCISFII